MRYATKGGLDQPQGPRKSVGFADERMSKDLNARMIRGRAYNYGRASILVYQ